MASGLVISSISVDVWQRASKVVEETKERITVRREMVDLRRRFYRVDTSTKVVFGEISMDPIAFFFFFAEPIKTRPYPTALL